MFKTWEYTCKINTFLAWELFQGCWTALTFQPIDPLRVSSGKLFITNYSIFSSHLIDSTCITKKKIRQQFVRGIDTWPTTKICVAHLTKIIIHTIINNFIKILQQPIHKRRKNCSRVIIVPRLVHTWNYQN